MITHIMYNVMRTASPSMSGRCFRFCAAEEKSIYLGNKRKLNKSTKSECFEHFNIGNP